MQSRKSDIKERSRENTYSFRGGSGEREKKPKWTRLLGFFFFCLHVDRGQIWRLLFLFNPLVYTQQLISPFSSEKFRGVFEFPALCVRATPKRTAPVFIPVLLFISEGSQARGVFGEEEQQQMAVCVGERESGTFST